MLRFCHFRSHKQISQQLLQLPADSSRTGPYSENKQTTEKIRSRRARCVVQKATDKLHMTESLKIDEVGLFTSSRAIGTPSQARVSASSISTNLGSPRDDHFATTDTSIATTGVLALLVYHHYVPPRHVPRVSAYRFRPLPLPHRRR